jgi:hypothetical protein
MIRTQIRKRICKVRTRIQKSRFIKKNLTDPEVWYVRRVFVCKCRYSTYCAIYV